MGGIINEAASHVSDNQVQHDHRQQASAKCTPKPFGQLVTKLDPKNKKHSNQPEQRAGGSGRRAVSGFENEARHRADSQARSNSQITRDHAAHSG